MQAIERKSLSLFALSFTSHLIQRCAGQLLSREASLRTFSGSFFIITQLSLTLSTLIPSQISANIDLCRSIQREEFYSLKKIVLIAWSVFMNAHALIDVVTTLDRYPYCFLKEAEIGEKALCKMESLKLLERSKKLLINAFITKGLYCF